MWVIALVSIFIAIKIAFTFWYYYKHSQEVNKAKDIQNNHDAEGTNEPQKAQE